MSIKISTFPFVVLRNVGNPGVSETGETRIFYNSISSSLQISNDGAEYSDIGAQGVANIALSNLYSVEVNSNLLPNSNRVHNFGSEALRWQDGYFSNIEADGTLNLDGYLHITDGVILDGYGSIQNRKLPLNVQTDTTYTLTAVDSGKILSFDNAAEVTVTIPAALPIGFSTDILQIGAGQVVLSPATGVTLNNRLGYSRIYGQNGAVSLIKYAAETFVLSGDTGAVPGLCLGEFVLGDATNPYAGSVTLSNDAQVAAFAASGYDAVTGDFTINGTVSSLVGCEDLKYVGGVLLIENAASLTNLSGFSGLRRVNSGGLGPSNPGITIQNCAGITSVELPQLHAVDGRININNCAALVNIDDAFPCLAEAGEIWLTDLNALESAQNLASGVAEIQYLYFDTLPTLTNITGAFENTVTLNLGLDWINIGAVTGELLPSWVVCAGGAYIYCDDSYLASLTSFCKNVTGIDVGTIDDVSFLGQTTSSMPTAQCLTALQEIQGRLDIRSSTASLANFFPALTVIGDAVIDGIAALTSVTGAFANLSTVNGPGTFTVSNNPALSSATQVQPLFVVLQANGIAPGDLSDTGNAL